MRIVTKLLWIVSVSLWAAEFVAAEAKGLKGLKAEDDSVEKAEQEADQEEAEQQAEPEVKKPEPPPPPSELSKSLANKLYVGTSLGFVSLSASEGEWGARAMGDLSAGYLLPTKIGANTALYGTFRYAPTAVTAVVDDLSYKGVVETYHFGALGRFGGAAKLTYFGTFEVGYVLVYLKSLDGITGDNELEENGVNVTAGGGADWRVLDKVTAGPRLSVGFGRMQTIQFAGQVGFVF